MKGGIVFLFGLLMGVLAPQLALSNSRGYWSMDNEVDDDYEIRTVNGTKLWPNGIVPYYFDRSVGMHLKVLIWKAMEEIEQKTCIKFVSKIHSQRKDWVTFKNSGSCGSSRGLVEYGEQFLYLGEGCHHQGFVFHEIFHVLGFGHEHERPDRDEYITVNKHNIKEGYEHVFDKQLPNETIILNPFDYKSIMLYSSVTFSKNRYDRLLTLVANDESVELRGPLYNERPSESDYWRLNKLYQCEEKLNE